MSAILREVYRLIDRIARTRDSAALKFGRPPHIFPVEYNLMNQRVRYVIIETKIACYYRNKNSLSLI